MAKIRYKAKNKKGSNIEKYQEMPQHLQKSKKQVQQNDILELDTQTLNIPPTILRALQKGKEGGVKSILPKYLICLEEYASEHGQDPVIVNCHGKGRQKDPQKADRAKHKLAERLSRLLVWCIKYPFLNLIL